MEQPVTTLDNAAPARSQESSRLLSQAPQADAGTPKRRRGPGVRRVPAVTGLVALALVALSACGDDGEADAGAKAAVAKASVAKIKVSAKDGAANASISGTGVTVSGGKLTDVKLTEANSGKEVAGAISSDGSSWKPGVQLERGTKYRIAAKAKDAKGRTATENSSFTTVSNANSFIGSYTPDDGKTVGVGMPVSF
ncbi:Ig-like domain-containing protein, partial [Streptomyces kronopolitis]|uniref:Ig-like domain-containing protein n=1 Tax=Streptomyces kronopolitis TaxID=1612435 RepID=UPI00341B382B